MPIVLGSKKIGRCRFCGGIIVKGEFSHRGWRLGDEWYVCVNCKKRRRQLKKIVSHNYEEE